MATLTPGDNKEPLRTYQVQEATDSESTSRQRATPREEKGGYDCEFVEPPPKQFQSECSICLLVLRNPHLISCCGHSFCEMCIERVQRDGKPCPLCNEPGFTTVANGGLKRSLNEFQVHCPHHELGCKWIGELGKFDQHLNINPQPECQLKGCPFASIKCIHCKDHMRRHAIAGHQNERCSRRPHTCEYCEEYKSTFEDVANHWAECKCYLLPCPNNCHPLGSGIKRQNLEHHMKEECPLMVVECDFHYAGCGVKLPRKDMAKHMKEQSVAHISLLAAENRKFVKQLLERDEKMQQLIQQNTELNIKIEQQQRAHQEITNQQQKAIQKIQQEQKKAHRDLDEIITPKADRQQKAMQELKKDLSQTKYIQQQQQRAHQELASKVADQIQGLQQMEELRQRSQLVPAVIKMSGFTKLKDNNTIWYSTPFYTHMCGYKMCLRVYSNGSGHSKGSHVSVFTCFVCGEFDSNLRWPYRGVITIQLLNQLEDREHHTETISYTDTTSDKCCSQVTIGERSEGRGLYQFIPHLQLNFNHTKNCQYLKDDCLIFRVLSAKKQQ